MLVKCLRDAAFLSASSSIIYIEALKKSNIHADKCPFFAIQPSETMEQMLCVSANNKR